jgi:hypothetical protein
VERTSFYDCAHCFFRRRIEEELREELDFHLEMQARKNRGRGLDETEAGRHGTCEVRQHRSRIGRMPR